MAQVSVKFEPYDDSDDIEDYFERLQLFFTVNGGEEDKQVAHLLSGLGAKTYAVLKNLTAPAAPSGCSLAQIKEKLVSHFKPKPPVIAERFSFHKRDQLPGEPIKDFVIELRRLARTCNFGGFLEEALRDRLVCGMTSSSTQKKLLAEKDLTLQRAIDIATAAEMAVLDHQQEATVSHQSEMHSIRYKSTCTTCGKRGHATNKCRFRLMTCYKCGKQGHLQAVCKEQVRAPLNADKHTVKQLEPATEQEEEMTIWTITGGQTEGYYIHLTINGASVKMELDTGRQFQ